MENQKLCKVEYKTIKCEQEKLTNVSIHIHRGKRDRKEIYLSMMIILGDFYFQDLHFSDFPNFVLYIRKEIPSDEGTVTMFIKTF